MEKLSWLKVLLLSIAIVISGYFIGNMQKIAKQYDRYVQVKGLSEREVKADLAVWPINITITGNDLKEIRQAIETQNQQVYDFFVRQGFDKNDLSIGSTNITDAKANIYNDSYRTSTFRYLAISEFTVRTTEIDKLKNALSESLELVSKGILISSKNTWRPIEYSFNGLNNLKPPMIEEATKNAREVAEKFAKDSNAKVGQIRIARQGLFSINDLDQNTPEIKIVRVVSTIDFQLED